MNVFSQTMALRMVLSNILRAFRIQESASIESKNIGAFYGYIAAKNATQGRFLRGRYFVGLPYDVLVTTNWLKNMLICMESDERIGFVVPMSDNTSNLQRLTGHIPILRICRRKQLRSMFLILASETTVCV